ncbi:dihydrolipoyl dehydrogenase [Paenibacillus sp. N1-5-1-14]|uniref:dihydrolipoyl dehydrogenase n=1 Tax=Paenibacillus radicibacter TaxID=2972488 RepID=UPI002159A40C|nr:dihydrolipoyl dehydrogenase [Paenibacillus radicibacter]MCR8643518.1 dihydrolipoyl dehydrogenase [Paenibacillus radicibacter]
MKTYDAVVLGGGPGGYVAAIRLSQLGKSVAVVERERLGGTCLNKGCIPSKSLLRSAEVYTNFKHSESFGIVANDFQLDFGLVQARKQKIVEQLHGGTQFLMKKNKIDVIIGHGKLTNLPVDAPYNGAVTVQTQDADDLVVAYKDLIIATGSRPRSLPGLTIDGKFVMTSDDALEMDNLPSSIIIVGGGVIGIEWASMLSDFGVKVTIVEYADRLVPLEDADISKELRRLMMKRGVTILTGAKLLAETMYANNQTGTVHMQVEHLGSVKDLEAEKALVSVGRQANVEQIGLEEAGVQVERGVIVVDTCMLTSTPHIYAIGDVNGGLQLAHVASHEGITAAEHIAGETPHSQALHTIPRCIYGRPEIASVGWTEEQAVAQGYEVQTGKYSFKALGKALVHGEADGFAKVITDKKTHDILGVHLIGPHVTEHISEAALAQFLQANSIQVGKMIHPHPTLSEIIGEAMLAVDGKAIGM